MRRFSAFLTSLLLFGPAVLSAADPEAWRSPMPAQPEILLVRGATVWTSGPAGMLENADVLVRRGRIAAVGLHLEAPAGALVIDAAGKHVTPGIIDAHSHIAVDGEVNEGTHIVTSEVRIRDVLNPEDPSIYYQLAGGTTTANVLHGSANAIGGQNAVIKLRWGAPATELLFAGATPTVKFALGENPKRSNRFPGDGPDRFPQTRQGVEQVIRTAFTAAQDYRRRQLAYRPGSDQVPPRRDLQLDALVEVLEGTRKVHSHCYRADEILMLLRVAEDFDFRIGTLQHVLEGYKVADEIAAHGAGASTFSDWWAFKYEVIDAIPYNPALMYERGVLVSLNSDNDELGRRLNQEAAKAVRYGGVPPTEALKMVTLNPALQLGVADRVGSLEPGKDADFVIWSGSPLSTASLAEQTWVDGRKYFDRAEDLAARPQLEAERLALMAKVRALKAPPKADDAAKPEDEAPAPELIDGPPPAHGRSTTSQEHGQP